MSYMSNSSYTPVVGDVLVKKGETLSGNTLIEKGNLRVEPHASCLAEVKLITPGKSVILEESSFIHHLHIMNVGEIHIKGRHALVVELLIEEPVTLHVPRGVEWRDLFETVSNESLLTVIQDN